MKQVNNIKVLRVIDRYDIDYFSWKMKRKVKRKILVFRLERSKLNILILEMKEKMFKVI